MSVNLMSLPVRSLARHFPLWQAIGLSESIRQFLEANNEERLPVDLLCRSIEFDDPAMLKKILYDENLSSDTGIFYANKFGQQFGARTQ